MTDIFEVYSKDDIDGKFSDLATPENISNINAQLAEFATHATTYGAKFDGSTDDTTAIQNALNSGASVVFLPNGKTTVISNTLTVPDNVTMKSEGTITTIKMLTKDIPATSIGAPSKLENLKILLPSGNTSDMGCGIFPRLAASSNESSYFVLENVFVKGTDATGNGIYITGSTGSLSFSMMNNIKFNRVLNALKINCTSPAYANAFSINNMICNTSTRLLYFTGYGCQGHVIDGVEWNQSGSTTEVMWFDGANDNNVRGYFYDLGDYGSTDILMKCTGASQGNIIHTSLDVNDTNINDTTSTRLNYIDNNLKKFSNSLNKFIQLPFGYLDSTYYNKWGYWSKFRPYMGWVENILAYSDKIHTVTTTPAPTAGSVSPIFDPMAQQNVNKPVWVLSGTSTAQIEIDFNLTLLSTTSKRLDYVGIFFGSSTWYPQTILIEAYDRVNGWATMSNITNNTLNYIEVQGERDGKSFGGDIQKIRITMSNSADAGGHITVEQIQARLLSNYGLSFLPRGGGNIYGDISFDSNHGPVIKDTSNGHTYRLISTNGTLSLQQVT